MAYGREQEQMESDGLIDDDGIIEIKNPYNAKDLKGMSEPDYQQCRFLLYQNRNFRK